MAARRAWLALGAMGAVLVAASDAGAVGSLSSGDHVPLEQRVALSIGPTRTTLWTQVRIDAQPGPLAMVVPAAPGAALDFASDAWFEALEMATAPRVLPPDGVTPACPGEEPALDPVHLVGDPFHVATITPVEVVELSDADAVATWALAHGFEVSTELYDAMVGLGGHRFVAARFNAPDGEVVTPALRVSGPGLAPSLPLVMTQASSAPLLVTAFTLAEGAAVLDGSEVFIDTALLRYDAAAGTTNYPALRQSALAGGGSWLLETTGRSPLTTDLSLASGNHTIERVVRTYFSRAALYDALSFDAPSCIAQVDAAMGGATVAASCPRADLGYVDGIGSCSETVQGGEVDPALLRCGNDADDLAVAMSEHDASATWLTRHSMELPAMGQGAMRSVGVAAQSPLLPILSANELDVSGCDEGGSGGSGAGGGGGTGGSGGSGGSGAGPVEVQVPVYEVHSGCGAAEIGAIVFYIAVDDDDAPDAYYYEAEDCGGDTAESYVAVYEDDSEDDGVEDEVIADATAEDCQSESSDSYEDGSDDDCGGDTSESYESSESESGESDDGCSGDSESSSEGSSDDGCSGDTESTSESSGESSSESQSSSDDDGCGGDTDSSSDDSSCSLAAPRHKKLAVKRRGPRASILMMALLAIVFPLRRLTRKR